AVELPLITQRRGAAGNNVEGRVRARSHVARARVHAAPVFEERAFLHVEVAIDRIHGDNGGQHSGRSAVTLKLNEVARGHEAAPDLAADRSLDLGVVQVDAGGGFAGFGGGEGGLRFQDRFAAAVVFLFGNCLGAAQTLGAFEI